ncbi:MAG: SusC/RagA family protein, partial [Parafilimonas sp.]
TASIDAYYRKTKDLLNTFNIPLGTNFSNRITDNVGNMTTKGVELQLNATPVMNKTFRWDFSYNIAYNKREITKLTANTDTSFVGNSTGPSVDFLGDQIQINSVGYAPYSFYAYKQIYGKDGSPIEGLYADLNRDGVINQKDLYHYKSPFAPVTMGFTNTVAYKNWSLNMVLRANIGNYMFNQVASNSGNVRAIIDPNHVIHNVPQSAFEASFQLPQVQSDYYLTNASFLKMDNIGLSYDAGKIFNNKANLIVGANCQNVFVITKYDGLDPEIFGGVDNNIYPRPRTYTLSLNLNF